MNNPRIGILGPTTLLGKEVASTVQERGLSFRSPRLLQLPPAPGTPEAGSTGRADGKLVRGLLAFGEEPAVLDELNAAAAAELDIVFLAGSGEDARRAWTILQHPSGSASGPLTIDLTGALASEPGAQLAGSIADSGVPARLMTTPHPASVGLADILGALTSAARLQTATAVVFEPASERGLAGIQTLEQQTVRLLSLQSQTEGIFDAQVAFNLRAALGQEASPSLPDVRQRISKELPYLLPGFLPAIELLQAPIFHATVLSVYVVIATPVPAIESLQAGFPAEHFTWHADFPDATTAANQDAIQLGPLRTEPASAGGFWIFASLDNLHRTAIAAIEAARSWHPEA